jgi:hypothetical protein
MTSCSKATLSQLKQKKTELYFLIQMKHGDVELVIRGKIQLKTVIWKKGLLCHACKNG